MPITGFANSVAAPAIEFKKEGQVFGIGCKIFTIAGPVILYGIVSLTLFSLYYHVLRQNNRGFFIILIKNRATGSLSAALLLKSCLPVQFILPITCGFRC